MRNSAISAFNKCPYNYKLQYVDQLEVLPNQDHDNPLYVGTAIHYGAETESAKKMLECYTNNYYLIGDKHINEMLKLEALLPKLLEVKHSLGTEFIHEYYFTCGTFHGTVDLIVQQEDGTVDLYDYKYCSKNSVEKYKESYQLHLYKYFLEQQGYKVGKLGFIFIPKTYIRQNQTEDLYQFRKRLEQELDKLQVTVHYLDYDHNKVIEAMLTGIVALETTEYRKNVSDACKFCPYQEYCLKGEDYMLLPSTERRSIKKVTKRKVWIYGAPTSGKTTMLDGAPNPLNLNTDGNINFVTMPFIPIKDEITVNGRVTNRKLAWEVFKDVIAELEKKQNDFKTIIVDLVEDTREMCRIYKYEELGIQHESDSGYGKGWDIIKTEYLSTMRRFFNLDYENLVILSHEDVSKDITKKNGQNITRIAPNIQDAIANKLAGMVDIVARVIINEDDTRSLSFKTDGVVFGGSRLKGLTTDTIPLSWCELVKVYDEASVLSEQEQPKNESIKEQLPKEETSMSVEEFTGAEEATVTIEESTDKVEAIEEEKPKRGRRSRKTE